MQSATESDDNTNI